MYCGFVGQIKLVFEIVVAGAVTVGTVGAVLTIRSRVLVYSLAEILN